MLINVPCHFCVIMAEHKIIWGRNVLLNKRGEIDGGEIEALKFLEAKLLGAKLLGAKLTYPGSSCITAFSELLFTVLLVMFPHDQYRA